MEKINEKISVLIPMYNAEKYIKRCLNSVVKQTYKNLEIIIANDGSTDNSYNIAKEFASNDDRIKIYTKQNEKSLSKTRQFLIDKLDTRLFVFVDSDDKLNKNYVKLLYNNMIKYDVDLVGTSYKIGNFLASNSLFSKNKIFVNNEIISQMVLSKNIHFVAWNKLYKTDIAKKVEFSDELSFGEDFDFCTKYAKLCKNAMFLNKRLYKYYLNKGSIIHENFCINNKLFLEYLIKRCESETNENDKNTLRAWVAFTSKYYKRLIKKSMAHNDEYMQFLDDNIKNNEQCFLKNKNTNLLYKIMYKFM